MSALVTTAALDSIIWFCSVISVVKFILFIAVLFVVVWHPVAPPPADDILSKFCVICLSNVRFWGISGE